jgi:hypothetical protein
MRVKHDHKKQERHLKDELRAQPAPDRQKTWKTKTGIPHSIAQTAGVPCSDHTAVPSPKL